MHCLFPSTAAIEVSALHSVWLGCAAEDTDAAKTVEDKLLTRSKLQLMRQFQWGVGAYVVSFAVVIVLPLLLYSPNTPDQDNLAMRIVIILQNLVLWGFLVALCFIFRCAIQPV